MLGKSLTGYEGKHHVWFEVAGDGNQDLISQAPSPDHTSRPAPIGARILAVSRAFGVPCGKSSLPYPARAGEAQLSGTALKARRVDHDEG
jgi:hypothetical protein